FTFTATPGASRYVANPCYNANVALLDPYSQACASMLANYGAGSGILTQPYMLIGASSDDPLINDVFYGQSSFMPPVCVSGVPSPGNPYTAFGISNYETGGVT